MTRSGQRRLAHAEESADQETHEGCNEQGRGKYSSESAGRARWEDVSATINRGGVTTTADDIVEAMTEQGKWETSL